MPWSGGTFTRIENWVNDKNANIPITASRMDIDSNDFTSGINSCLNKDGSNTPTAPLNMGSFRLTNLADGTLLTDAASVSQVQAGTISWGIAGGYANALTLTLSPAQTSIADGTVIGLRAGTANTATAPTFALNGTTARAITKLGGLPLLPGDIRGQYAETWLRYNSGNTRWELLNPANLFGILGKSGATTSTGADTTEDTLATIALPANVFGANGVIKFQLLFQTTNSGNAKTARVRWSGGSGTVIASHSMANAAGGLIVGLIQGTNATNAQLTSSYQMFTPAGTPTVAIGINSAIDTTGATTFAVTGQKVSAGETMSLLGYVFELVSDGT